jgi:hypothetical protein
LLPPSSGQITALMMEAANTYETLVNFYQTTQRNNPEYSHLQSSLFSRESVDHINATSFKPTFRNTDMNAVRRFVHYLEIAVSNWNITHHIMPRYEKVRRFATG